MTKITIPSVNQVSSPLLRAQRSNPVTLLGSSARHTSASKVAGWVEHMLCAKRQVEGLLSIRVLRPQVTEVSCGLEGDVDLGPHFEAAGRRVAHDAAAIANAGRWAVGPFGWLRQTLRALSRPFRQGDESARKRAVSMLDTRVFWCPSHEDSRLGLLTLVRKASRLESPRKCGASKAIVLSGEFRRRYGEGNLRHRRTCDRQIDTLHNTN